LFKSKQRIASAWAKGLMFGKAVGARDERDRIIALIEANYDDVLDYLGLELGLKESDILLELIERIRGQRND
jgi:hypothetical protein